MTKNNGRKRYITITRAGKTLSYINNLFRHNSFRAESISSAQPACLILFIYYLFLLYFLKFLLHNIRKALSLDLFSSLSLLCSALFAFTLCTPNMWFAIHLGNHSIEKRVIKLIEHKTHRTSVSIVEAHTHTKYWLTLFDSPNLLCVCLFPLSHSVCTACGAFPFFNFNFIALTTKVYSLSLFSLSTTERERRGDIYNLLEMPNSIR